LWSAQCLPLRACGARPSRGASRGEMALRRKARGSRERRFSRRDALCASAWQGRAQAGASHGYGRANERLVAKKRQHFGWRDVDIAGVRSPPLRGVDDPRRDGLPEKGPGIARKAVFSEGRTLCVRVARPHECRGIPFAADGLRMSRWPKGHMPRSSPSPPCGRAEPAPPRNGQAKPRRPYRGRPEDGATGGFLGGTRSARP
jgi:hypothetical protein